MLVDQGVLEMGMQDREWYREHHRSKTQQRRSARAPDAWAVDRSFSWPALAGLFVVFCAGFVLGGFYWSPLVIYILGFA